MRFALRKRPTVKAVAYAALMLLLLLFSASFFPALHLSVGTPNLILPAIALVACMEGVEYATLLGLIFGVLESYILAENILVLPLAYVLFAVLCAKVLRGIASRNFWIWLLLVFAGELGYILLGLFPAVAHWQVSALRLLDGKIGASLFWSMLLALPLYPAFRRIARKTDV